MTTSAPTAAAPRPGTGGVPHEELPRWDSVLAVVAHPDDESFALGAVLPYLAERGAEVHVLCLTHGERSTLTGDAVNLAQLRELELKTATTALGATSAMLKEHPDGSLAQVGTAPLATDVADAIRETRAQALLAFDPSGVTGHPDHAAATAAALVGADAAGLPVLGWTLPREVADQLNAELDTGFVGHDPADIDVVLPIERSRQLTASLAHASQAVPTSVLWRRLELLGDREHLRWLRRPSSPEPAGARQAAAAEDGWESMRVDYAEGDRFGIAIRDHVLTVDQPTSVGGDDLGPTPTELFVASLASCVGFYARRYLRRHHLDATGLTVQTRYRLAAKPARVSDVDLRIEVPTSLPEARQAGLLAVARHCTVHNSITMPPEISVELDGSSR